MNAIIARGKGIMRGSISRGEFEHKRKVRLERKYRPSKIRWVEKLEELYEDKWSPDGDYLPFFKMLKTTIQMKARAYERRWKNFRLSAHDFESVFWEVTWKIIEFYHYDNPYMLVETLELAWKRRALDVIRSATRTNRGRVWHTAVPLKDRFEQFYPDPLDMEEMVADSVVVQQIMSEAVLTTDEKKLLQAIYSNPEATNRELAELMKRPHMEYVRRTLKKIRGKLAAY